LRATAQCDHRSEDDFFSHEASLPNSVFSSTRLMFPRFVKRGYRTA
jgi:hypothetical protein